MTDAIQFNQFRLAGCFLLTCGLFCLASMTGYCLNLHHSRESILLLFLITSLAACWIQQPKDSSRAGAYIVFHFLAIISLMAMATYASEFVFDTSADSQTDHLQGVDYILHGWNPVLDTGYAGRKVVLDQGIAPWNKYLALVAGRMPYLLWSVGYAITGHLDSGKGINFLLAAALVLQAYECLLRRQVRHAKLITALVFLNPILLGFLFSHYADHLVYLFFIYLLCAAANYLENRKDVPVRLHLASAVFLFCGTKLTAFAYGGIVCAAVILLLGLRKQYRKTAEASAIMLVAALIAAISPVLVNIHLTGSPIPLLGFGVKGTPPSDFNMINVTWPEQKAWYLSHSNVTRLFESAFSQTICNPKDVPMHKNPLRIYGAEINNILRLNADARMGGFGPYFGLSLIISALVLCLSFCVLSRRVLLPLMLSIAVIFLTVLSNEMNWWARFVPQFWLIPVIIAGFGLHYFTRPHQKILVYALAAALMMNALIYAGCTLLGTLEVQRAANIFLSQVLQYPQATIYFENYYAWRKRLDERNVHYTDLPNHCQTPSLRAPRTNVTLCLPKSAQLQDDVYKAVRDNDNTPHAFRLWQN